MNESYQKLSTLIRRVQFKKYVVLVISLLSCLEALSAVIYPLLTQQLVDGLSSGALPWGKILILCGVLLFSAVLTALNMRFIGQVGQSFVLQTRQRLHKHLLLLPVYQFEKGQAAEPANRLASDTVIIGEFISKHVASSFGSVIVLVLSVAILLSIDKVLTLALLTCIAISLLVIFPLATGMTKITHEKQHSEANLIGRLAEVFMQIRLVKQSGAEQAEVKLSQPVFDKLFGLGMKEIKLFSLLGPSVSIAISASLIVVLTVGVSRVGEGAISIGAFVAFILYLFNVAMPVTQLSIFAAELNKASGAAIRLTELEASEEEHYGGDEVSLQGQQLEIKKLQFTYPGKTTPSLNIDSLIIEPNQITALVGESGAGKTSVFTLINRLYQSEGIYCRDTEGKLQTISQFNLRQWREQIANVSQSSPVLSGTVEFNLNYGLEKPLDSQSCFDALEKAQLLSFIEDNEGLHTQLGEQGVNLSGGQRQRLSIARAILRQPKLLLLDEATSALDTQTERAVNDALFPIMQSTTTVVVAHRLSTVLNADKIVLLHQGRVIAEGAHTELLGSSPAYHKLVQEQLVDS